MRDYLAEEAAYIHMYKYLTVTLLPHMMKRLGMGSMKLLFLIQI